MRVVTASCLALLAATVCAAPVTPPDTAKSPASPDHALHAEANNYARILIALVDRIEEAYVRPVNKADLYEAALVGLFEAAREPVPAGLRIDVRQALQNDLESLLVRVRENLGEPDALRGQKALLVSLQALPRALDPYCGLTPRHEFQRLGLTDGTYNSGLEFVGVPLPPITQQVIPNGIRQIDIIPVDAQPPVAAGPLRVLTVQPGSPAQRAGIRPDDMIVRLDGHPPESREFAAAFQRLRPVPSATYGGTTNDTVLQLTIIRPGQKKPFEVTVGMADYRAESVFGARRKADSTWDFLLDPSDRIGYVRISGIRGQSSADFVGAMESLRASGVRGLILDLRWCPGGLLDEAVTIARALLPSRISMPVYWECDKAGAEKPVSMPLSGQLYFTPFADVPVVVLVSGETSGGGELIAAALQDHGRAVVAGQRTVGKASIQKPVPGVEFNLTQLTFRRPSRKNLQRFPDSRPTDDWGVRPDPGRELPLTHDAGRRLKEWWMLQTLRRPDDTGALPLDDPENDPQRVAAIEMLREMMKKPG
jgi:carboxyl-terminal processing protease